MSRTHVLVGAALLLALVGLGGVSLVSGRGQLSDGLTGVFLELRAVRASVAAVIGAGLAVAGVLAQGLFRNPLAEPGIIGVGAAANLGGLLALLAAVFLGLQSSVLVPVGCFAGAVLALVILQAVLLRTRESLTVLLTGVVLGLAFAALGALVISLQSAEYELGFALLAFSMGSVSGKGLHHLFMALPLVIAGVLAAIAWGRQLDLLLTGEEEARALGLRLDQVRRWVIVWIAVLVAAAVAVGGNIAFVGLVVPHLIRRMCGPLHRGLVPVAALGGAVFVVACDWLARSWPGHGELPLGVVTGLVGAPLFLVLLLRRRGAAFA